MMKISIILRTELKTMDVSKDLVCEESRQWSFFTPAAILVICIKVLEI